MKVLKYILLPIDTQLYVNIYSYAGLFLRAHKYHICTSSSQRFAMQIITKEPSIDPERG